MLGNRPSCIRLGFIAIMNLGEPKCVRMVDKDLIKGSSTKVEHDPAARKRLLKSLITSNTYIYTYLSKKHQESAPAKRTYKVRLTTHKRLRYVFINPMLFYHIYFLV